MELPLKKMRHLLSRKKEKKQSILWILLIGIFLTVSTAYLLFATPLLTPPAENILPADDLVFFADIGDPDCSSLLAKKAPSICRYRSELLFKIFGSYPERLTSFSDRLAIVGYQHAIESRQAFFPTLLLRIRESKSAEDFVRQQPGSETVTEGTTNGIRFYHFQEPQKRIILFWRGWLIVTQDDSFTKKLLAVKRNEIAPFSGKSHFQKLLSASDASQKSYAYFETDTLLRTFQNIPDSFAILANFLPRGILSFSDNSLGANLHLTALKKETSKNEEIQRTNTKNRKYLLSALPEEDPIFLLSLENLRREIENAFSFLEKTDPAFSLFLHGKLQKMLAHIFGTDISLEFDIFPLLEDEILITAYESDEGIFPLLLVSLSDLEFAQVKKDKILESLKNTTANLVPRLVSHILEDGTEIREIEGCNECVQVEEESFEKGDVHTFIAEDESGKKKVLALGMTPDMFSISPQPVYVKDAITHVFDEKNIPKILNRIPNFFEKKEVILFQQKILDLLFPSFAKPTQDFSLFYATHSEKGDVWNISLRAEYK